MLKKQFLCVKCDRTFETEVFERGEAEAKKLSFAPVRCPICSDTAVVDPKKIKG